jgi:hypothetical protein
MAYSETNRPRVAVLYLDRFANGKAFARMFLTSIARNKAGYDYEYIHVLKGYPDRIVDEHKRFVRSIAPTTVTFAEVDDRNLPVSSFRRIASDIDHDQILMFLSWSRVLQVNWLKYYVSAFHAAPDIGIVGATGSYERRNNRDLAAPFPNIAIRTNAFLMDRMLYVQLAQDIVTRDDELNFESGADSLTAQIMRRGMRPTIVDRSGALWDSIDWPRSNTFRSGRQENLLVADNRTHDYDRVANSKRRRLAQITWGDESWAKPIGPFERLWNDIRWRHQLYRFRRARSK